MNLLLERFLRYIAVETRADSAAGRTPSTPGQLQLAAMLADELKALGLNDVRTDEHGYVQAIVPGNRDVPRIALIAHLDTAPDLPGQNDEVNIFTYEGRDIQLPSGAVITEEDFPALQAMKGETLITTKGDTLLGADNKAGVAIIMTVADMLLNGDIPHGDIALVFTPDEEIGHGADLLDLDALGAAFGFTIDGGELGEFETETFNAAKASIEIKGRITHPGTARHVMVNAALIATELAAMLPAGARPELTDGREGFFMIDKIDAGIEEATVKLIIRDHAKEQFEEKKDLLEAAVTFLNQKYGDRLSLTLEDQYYNMAAVLDDHPEIAAQVEKAMQEEGITPKRVPVRGGTDGARLTYRGLPCPNLFTGGYNFHSKTEFASLDQMQASVRVLLRFIRNFAG